METPVFGTSEERLRVVHVVVCAENESPNRDHLHSLGPLHYPVGLALEHKHVGHWRVLQHGHDHEGVDGPEA